MEKKRREVKTSGREEENKMKKREKKKENREKDHKIIKKEKKNWRRRCKKLCKLE